MRSEDVQNAFRCAGPRCTCLATVAWPKEIWVRLVLSVFPAGRDLSEALWSHWLLACTEANMLLQFWLTESRFDGALTRLLAARSCASAIFLTTY